MSWETLLFGDEGKNQTETEKQRGEHDKGTWI